jgi:hypothetical protein
MQQTHRERRLIDPGDIRKHVALLGKEWIVPFHVTGASIRLISFEAAEVVEMSSEKKPLEQTSAPYQEELHHHLALLN